MHSMNVLDSVAGFCHKLSSGKAFQTFFIILIVLTGISMGLETYPAVTVRYGAILHGFDRVVLVLFIGEVSIRLLALGRSWSRFFKNGWNTFDFVIVVLSSIPAVGETVLVVRLFRLMRLLRLIKAVPELRLIIDTLLGTLPSMGYLALLMGVLFYIYAVLGTLALGGNDPVHFGNLHLSVVTLFQVLTLEGWADLLKIAMMGCDRYGYDGIEALCIAPKAQPLLGVAYYISFVIVGTFLLLNMVIGFIMENLQNAKARTLDKAESEGHTTVAEHPHLSERLARLKAEITALEQDLLKSNHSKN